MGMVDTAAAFRSLIDFGKELAAKMEAPVYVSLPDGGNVHILTTCAPTGYGYADGVKINPDGTEELI